MAIKRDRKSATIYITKLGAAERLLHAAIRWSLADEDELAIHVVASSAYNVLRDLMKKQGRGDYPLAPLVRGAYFIARDMATGKLKAMPGEIANVPTASAMVIDIKNKIESGEVKSLEDVQNVRTANDQVFWRNFNKPYNFLKHADNDSNGALAMDSIDNKMTIFRACHALEKLTNRYTPEMEAYGLLILGGDPEFSPLPEALRIAFSKLSPAQQRKRCLALLKFEKGGW